MSDCDCVCKKLLCLFRICLKVLYKCCSCQRHVQENVDRYIICLLDEIVLNKLHESHYICQIHISDNCTCYNFFDNFNNFNNNNNNNDDGGGGGGSNNNNNREATIAYPCH